MTTVADMKRHVASLVETNRALASDLEASRALVERISRQRDSLRGQLEQTARSLMEELHQVQTERDELRDQLAEATEAMNEIRDSLRNRLSTVELGGWTDQPSYR